MNYSKASWALLGALRFGLAFLVFEAHLLWVGLPASLAALSPFAIGPAAVLGFLLISGVSIGCSYRERPSGFYTRRFLRIYPLYFAAIAFTLLVGLFVSSPVVLPALQLRAAGLFTTVANLFLLQGIVAIPLPYDGPLWTLSLEAWLYVFTPLFWRASTRTITLFAIASLFLFSFRGGTFLAELPVLGLFRWAWPWFAGFLMAREQRKSYAMVIGLAGAIQFLFNRELSMGPANVWLFIAVLLTIRWAGWIRLPQSVVRCANFLGDWSYPLYLFHLPLIILLYRHFAFRAELGFVLTVLLFTAALDVYYEGTLKRVFWRPLTERLVRRFPTIWKTRFVARHVRSRGVLKPLKLSSE